MSIKDISFSTRLSDEKASLRTATVEVTQSFVILPNLLDPEVN